MTPDDLDFLTSSAGESLLERLAHEDLSDQNTLPLLTTLRKTYDPAQAGAALKLAQLREKARGKFGAAAARMFFTEAALQQASDPLVRAYRASRVEATHVADLCCGVGSDALAFAAVGQAVTGYDRDPLRVRLASLNAAALGLSSARFEIADVTDQAFQPQAEMIFFDPARRDPRGNRIYDVTRYQPPLATIDHYAAPLRAVKLSPGVDLAQLEDYAGHVEFISVAGELKEALLWLDGTTVAPSATLLVDEAVHHWRPPPTMLAAPVDVPRRWLVEPDPALIRAGLVQAVAAAYDGALLDPTIAYFTTDIRPQTPWCRAWEILDWLPFNLKKLRAALRARGVGPLTVKKRGSAITPETLIRKLKLNGDERCTVVLTRYDGAQIALICADYTV
jgi:SAM-dependent methyltransferase